MSKKLKQSTQSRHIAYYNHIATSDDLVSYEASIFIKVLYAWQTAYIDKRYRKLIWGTPRLNLLVNTL